MPGLPRREPFGVMPDGTEVERYTFANAGGIEIAVITRGAAITSLVTPDREGMAESVVLGFDDLEGYLAQSFYCGAVVGRYANRIAGGRFTLDGTAHQLTRNDGPNHLHGGAIGFDRVVWQASPFQTATSSGVTLTHRSPAGTEGYPGTLEAEVRYQLDDRNELTVDYQATTDAPTPVNLTQHTYWNLARPGRDILGHRLTIHADGYLPVDQTLIPTGDPAEVTGGPFDFRSSRAIGACIDADDPQILNGRGYDHSFVLRGATGSLHPAVSVVEPVHGRTLQIITTEPGLQLYSGNLLDGSTGGMGRRHLARSGVCLETHHFPDSPNRPAFPPTILRPGGRYGSRTIYQFGVLHGRGSGRF